MKKTKQQLIERMMVYGLKPSQEKIELIKRYWSKDALEHFETLWFRHFNPLSQRFISETLIKFKEKELNIWVLDSVLDDIDENYKNRVGNNPTR